jgi:hypothetical protein
MVSSATTDVASQLVPDFSWTKVGGALKHLPNAHDHPGGAIAALQRVMLLERGLDRVQVIARGKTFDCRDLGTVRHDRENGARFDGIAIDIDCARTALRRIAPDMCPGQAEVVAQSMHQQAPRLHGYSVNDAIDA